MSAVFVGGGSYSYRKDKDSRGVYFFIVDPSGKDLVPLDNITYVQILLPHLNRGGPEQVMLSKGAHTVVAESPGADLSPFPMDNGRTPRG